LNANQYETDFHGGERQGSQHERPAVLSRVAPRNEDFSWGRHAALWREAFREMGRVPSRVAVMVAAIVVMTTPLVAALALSEGMKDDYALMVGQGGDVYVTRDLYGSNGPIERDAVARFGLMEGVIQAVTRVIGRANFQGKLFAVLGLDSAHLPHNIAVVEGAGPSQSSEVMIGRKAANHLGLSVNDKVWVQTGGGQELLITSLD